MIKKICVCFLLLLTACSSNVSENNQETKEFRNVKVVINDEINDYDLQYLRDFETTVDIVGASDELKEINIDEISLYIDINHNTVSLGTNYLNVLNDNPELNLTITPDNLKVVATNSKFYLPNFDLDSYKLNQMTSFATLSKIPQMDNAYFLTTGIVESENSDYYLSLDQELFSDYLVKDINYSKYNGMLNGLGSVADYQNKNVVYTIIPLYISDLTDFKQQLTEYEIPLFNNDEVLGKVKLSEIIQTITTIDTTEKQFTQIEMVKVKEENIFNYKGIDFVIPYDENLKVYGTDDEIKLIYDDNGTEIILRDYLVSKELMFANIDNYFYSKPIYENSDGIRVIDNSKDLSIKETSENYQLIIDYNDSSDLITIN